MHVTRSLSNEENQMVLNTKTVIVSSEKMGIYFRGKRGITWGLVFSEMQFRFKI